VNAGRVQRIVRGGWWLVLLGALLGGTAALVAVIQLPRTYTAETELFIASRATGTPLDVLQGDELAQQRVASYARLVDSEEMAERLIDTLHLRLRPQEVSDLITAEVVPDTVLIRVEVTATSPDSARAIAESVGALAPDLLEEVESAGGGAPPVLVRVVDDADLPEQPSGPGLPISVAVGVLAGLFVGVVAAVARERLDRSITDPEAAEAAAGAPVLGVVLRNRLARRQRVLDRADDGWTGEDFRLLRANLQCLRSGVPPRVVLVAAPHADGGASTLAVNLACVLADAGQRVAVVDADLRDPEMTGYLDLGGRAGLSHVLTGLADVDDVVQQYGEGRFSVLAAGPRPPRPGELLGSQNMERIVEKLRAAYDVVLIDGPPLLTVADATGLVPLTDGVLLSVRYGVTEHEQVHKAATLVGRVGGTVLGVVLNVVPASAPAASTAARG
jgi:receptor protein-tyrosine kinase